jgi:hypothetical protein
MIARQSGLGYHLFNSLENFYQTTYSVLILISGSAFLTRSSSGMKKVPVWVRMPMKMKTFTTVRKILFRYGPLFDFALWET